jgi:hypothetical protein
MIEILQHKTGRIVKWWTRSRYGHTSIRVDDWIYEARFSTGVTRRYAFPSKHPSREKVDVFRLRVALSPRQELQLWKFLDAQVGKKYDWWMAVGGFGLRLTREARKSRGKWFCSEIVYAALEKVGAYLFNRTEPFEVPPGLLTRSPSLVLCETDVLR